MDSWNLSKSKSRTDALFPPNQERHLQQIEGRWSDEALASRADFTKGWDDEKEQKFTIALRYYKKTGYYNNIVYKYLDQDDGRTGTPTEKEYNKLVLNKYASAVITNALSESQFPVGTTAIFRANAGYGRKNMPVVVSAELQRWQSSALPRKGSEAHSSFDGGFSRTHLDRGTIPQKSQEEKVEFNPARSGLEIRGEFLYNIMDSMTPKNPGESSVSLRYDNDAKCVERCLGSNL